MNKRKITLYNDFHNTEVTLYAVQVAPGHLTLNKRQVERTRRALCGGRECHCGTVRGPALIAGHGQRLAIQYLDRADGAELLFDDSELVWTPDGSAVWPPCWAPTHKITFRGRQVLVMLSNGGAAYSKEEWETEGPAKIERRDDGGWFFLGEPVTKSERVEDPCDCNRFSQEETMDSKDKTGCPKCGGKDFAIDSLIVATSYVEYDSHNDKFIPYDDRRFDTEWTDEGTTRCATCGWEAQTSVALDKIRKEEN